MFKEEVPPQTDQEAEKNPFSPMLLALEKIFRENGWDQKGIRSFRKSIVHFAELVRETQEKANLETELSMTEILAKFYEQTRNTTSNAGEWEWRHINGVILKKIAGTVHPFFEIHITGEHLPDNARLFCKKLLESLFHALDYKRSNVIRYIATIPELARVAPNDVGQLAAYKSSDERQLHLYNIPIVFGGYVIYLNIHTENNQPGRMELVFAPSAFEEFVKYSESFGLGSIDAQKEKNTRYVPAYINRLFERVRNFFKK